jgi:hypothetical protein
MYDDFVGVVIVSIAAIFKPVEDKMGNVNEDERWKGTMGDRLFFYTRNSALKSKDKKTMGIIWEQRPGTSRADESTEPATFQFAASSAQHLETGPKRDCSASDGPPTFHLKQIGNARREIRRVFACRS